MKQFDTLWIRLRELPGRLRQRLQATSPTLIVGLLCFVIYLYRPLVQSSRDNLPLRWGATLLATRGTLNFAELPIDPNRFYSLQVLENGSVRSHTPIGTALLAAPIFWLARGLGMEFTDENVVFLDGLAATILTAAAMAMVTHLARSSGRAAAIFVGLAAGLTTASWSTASRCLWQHTGAQFSLLAALCVLEGNSHRVARLVAGAGLLAYTFWCRPALAPVISVVSVFALARRRRDAIVGGLAAGLVLCAWALYNWSVYGSPLGTYVKLEALGPDTWASYPRRLFGHLFSPNRGMFIFSPLLLLAVTPMVRHAFRVRQDPWLGMLAWASLVGILVRGFFYGWHGGHCYGSRHSLDVTALMLLGAAPSFATMLRHWPRATLVAVLFALSAFMQFLGVARDYESWNVAMNMSQETNAWNWRRPQWLHCLTYGESTRGPLPSLSAVALPSNGVLDLRRHPDSPYLRYGITEQDPWGTWIMPPRAGIVFAIDRPRDLRLRCELWSQIFPYDPTTIELWLNGKKFGELVLLKLDPDFQDTPWFNVSNELVREGLNTLELRLNRACYPYGSPAPVGAALNRIIIVPR